MKKCKFCGEVELAEGDNADFCPLCGMEFNMMVMYVERHCRECKYDKLVDVDREYSNKCPSCGDVLLSKVVSVPYGCAMVLDER